jgi:putative tryptophan/tyrosine transport system substrate-binding protein
MGSQVLTRRRLIQGSVALAGLTLLSGCGRLSWQAQAKVPRVGCLSLGGPGSTLEAPFRRGLADLGYIEGQTIVIEWRGDAARAEQLAENVAELLALDLNLIVAVGEPRARAAKDATSTIPIVLSAGVDPIGAGLIESFNRPGGNVTGVIESLPQLHGKQLELLRALSPGMTRVTIVTAGGGDGGLTAASRRREEIEVAARALGLELRVLTASTAEALAEALSREAGERTEAVLTLHSGFMSSQQQQIFDFAARRRLPVMYGNRLYAEAGGLAAYGPDLLAIHYRAATYVDKILKGADPAELAVEQPTKLDFIINLNAAQAIGLTIPQSVLQQATEVIQ